jgi:hypothetical protein
MMAAFYTLFFLSSSFSGDTNSGGLPLVGEQVYATNAVAAVPPPNRIAYLHSFGLFHDIPNEEWEQLRAATRQGSWYAEPDNPLADVYDAPLWNKKNMNPNFICPRMGSVGQGGQRTKLMCHPGRLAHRMMDDDPNGDCLIYSVGSAGDFSFEDDIARMHNNKCEIHIFDPADWSRKGDETMKNIHYHAWGMKSTYDNSPSVVWPRGRKGGFKTFQDTMALLGHSDNRTIDLLKIDCEGCEFSTLRDWINLDIRQILIEIHGVPTPKGTPNQRWYQKPLDIHSEYFKAFSDNGYALYSKDAVNDLATELSFIKLHKNFWVD